MEKSTEQEIVAGYRYVEEDLFRDDPQLVEKSENDDDDGNHDFTHFLLP